MSAVLQQLPTIGDVRSADKIPSIKISFDKWIKSIEREMCPWAISISILVIRCPTHIE
jgi:hypothetical protein